MTRKLLRLFFICSLLVPPSVFALGIGQIEVNSALNQPLDAEIGLNALEGVDLERFSVSLASPDAFSRAGIERSPLLRELEFSVEARPGGQGVIKVTSPRPIREPILDFLVELSWPQGRLLREFAILLEPTAALARRPARPAPAPTPAPRATTAPSPPVERGTQTYGPVPYGDTLWNIAQQVRHPAIGMQEMMQALLRANPQAFSRPDIDYLLAGTTLRIPSPGEIDPRYAGLEMPTPQVAQVAPPTETATPDAEPQRQPDQVRLMPPDAVAEEQPQPASATTVSETAARPTTETTPSLSPSFRIQLEEGRPQLKLAGLEDLRDTLARVETPTLSAIQTREEALSPPSQQAVTDEIPPEEALPETTPGPEPAFEEIPPEAEPLPPEPAFEETLPEVAQMEPTEEVRPEVAPVEPTPVPQVPAEADTAPSELVFEETLPEEVVPETAPVEPLPAPVETTSDVAPSAEPAVESPNVVTDLPSAEEAVDTPQATPSAPTAETEPGADTGQPSAVMQVLTASLRDPQILALFGLLLLLLIGLALWLNRRSKKSGEVEDLAFELAGQDQQAASQGAGADTDKTVVEPISRKPKPFRPLRSSLERVDLLLAVGNYKEAEKVVRQAYSEDSSNTALASKLLEVHHASGNAEAFFKEAEALQAKLKNKADPVWQHVAHMGRDFYPDHPLFKGGPTLEKSAVTPGERPSPRPETKQAANERPLKQEEGLDTLDFAAVAAPGRTEKSEDEKSEQAKKEKTSDALPDLDWQLPDVEPPTATTGPSKPSLDEEEPKTESRELGFDFDEITSTRKSEEVEPLTEFSRLPDVEPPTATTGPSKPSLGEEEPKTEPKELDFDFDEVTSARQWEEPMEEPLTETKTPDEVSLTKERRESQEKSKESLGTRDELDWQLPDAEPPTGTSRALSESDLDSEPQLESLDFEFEELDKRTDMNEGSADVGSTSEDYVETKLDLALAYIDMGDSAGARSLLEEVMREGSSAQKQRAEEYMERLR